MRVYFEDQKLKKEIEEPIPDENSQLKSNTHQKDNMSVDKSSKAGPHLGIIKTSSRKKTSKKPSSKNLENDSLIE